jgi:parvulin-like peptidyl-prolyl isomerase
VFAQVKKEPAKFAELAQQHSACPSKAKGGSLGKWRVGRMIPEFDAAVQKMKVGDLVGPVETSFGFHIIRRDDLASAGQ